uniref:C-type lectin domain-containing protein n=1 Tax=Denticeps clupeoides TaxID=299321 RepID=A0AAY4BVJ5_9TELE
IHGTGQRNFMKNSTIQECVSIDSTLYFENCSIARFFYCYENVREFIMVSEKKTWDDALDYCRVNYTDMASVLSEKELSVILMKSAGEDNIWISLRFVYRYWLWLSGDALEYQVWGTDAEFQYNHQESLRHENTPINTVDIQFRMPLIMF